MGGDDTDDGTRPLSRRGFLWVLGGLIGGTAVGEGVLLARDMDSSLPMEMNIYQTEQLHELAAAYGRDTDHAPDIVKKHAEDAFDQLFEDAGLAHQYEISVIEDPVGLAYDGEDIDALNNRWDRLLDDREDSASGANLLLCTGSYDALGHGESGQKLDLPVYEQQVCGTTNEITDSSVLVDGERLLAIPPDDIRDQVKVKEYVEDDGEATFYDPPHEVAFAGVHELGHNTCLHHDMGDMYVDEQENGEQALYVSLLMNTYRHEYMDEENHAGEELPDPEKPYDVFYENRFSETAATAYRNELEGL